MFVKEKKKKKNILRVYLFIFSSPCAAIVQKKYANSLLPRICTTSPPRSRLSLLENPVATSDTLPPLEDSLPALPAYAASDTLPAGDASITRASGAYTEAAAMRACSSQEELSRDASRTRERLSISASHKLCGPVHPCLNNSLVS